jgi:IS30 family transposase
MRFPSANDLRKRKTERLPGHWEGDLLSGGKNSYIATLVERHSRFLMLVKVPGKETEAVVAAVSEHVRKLPATLRRSLTWDRGLEMAKAKHKEFTVATGFGLQISSSFCSSITGLPLGNNLCATTARQDRSSNLLVPPVRAL